VRTRLLGFLIFLFLVSSLGGEASGQRKLTEEGGVFLATRDAVFTVYGDHGTGSGFLVDSAGLVLTNFHVVGLCQRISVQLDDSTRIPATLLVEDKQKDIAVLRISPLAVGHRLALRLARRNWRDLAFEGEKVIAIGNPLHQTRIVTSGIVSKVEEGAIISDVNLNPGNSGGPLINMDGEVIAINTFIDASPQGPGLSGSIPISLSFPKLDEARKTLSSFDIPPLIPLPVTPKDPFPLEGLRWAYNRSGKDENYAVSLVHGDEVHRTGGVAAIRDGTYKSDVDQYDSGFNVTFFTPTRKHVVETRDVRRLATKRQKRETSAGIANSGTYDPVGARLKEWRAYVGEYAPVVVISVIPQIGETGGSVFLNLLGSAAAAYAGTYWDPAYIYEFKADLRDFQLMRGDSTVYEVFRVLDIMPVSMSIGNVNMDDVAQMGTFAFLSDVFENINSTNLHMRLWDLKRPKKVIDIPVPRQCLEQIWVDFEPYRDMLVGKKVRLLLPRER